MALNRDELNQPKIRENPRNLARKMFSKSLHYGYAWIKSGSKVYYHPIINENERFAGVVVGEPYLLGGHTWVVQLDHMEQSYTDWRKGAATKPGPVCLEALEFRE